MKLGALLEGAFGFIIYVPVLLSRNQSRELMIRNTRNGNIEYIVGLDGVSINVNFDFFYTEGEQ